MRTEVVAHFYGGFEVRFFRCVGFEEPVRCLTERHERCPVGGGPFVHDGVQDLRPRDPVEPLLQNRALFVEGPAAAVIANAESVTRPVIRLQPRELVHTPGHVLRSAADRTREIERDVEIARGAPAVGIDHHEDGPAAQHRLALALLHLQVGALAGSHGTDGMPNPK
jgi:hypothetical protein